MIKTISTNHRMCHFMVGTPFLFTIHTPSRILLEDILLIGPVKLLVTEILLSQKSRVYPTLNFYEIRYEAV